MLDRVKIDGSYVIIRSYEESESAGAMLTGTSIVAPGMADTTGRVTVAVSAVAGGQRQQRQPRQARHTNPIL